MSEIKIDLENRRVEVLTVNFGDTAVNIPLGGSIPITDVQKIETAEGAYNFIMSHIPTEIAKQMTLEHYNEILNAWAKATKETFGITVGESKASAGLSQSTQGL